MTDVYEQPVESEMCMSNQLSRRWMQGTAAVAKRMMMLVVMMAMTVGTAVFCGSSSSYCGNAAAWWSPWTHRREVLAV
ncbi:unnamed protein product [Pylaiella littoralis]